MLMILLLAVSQEPPATETDQFMALGRMRADFGDKPLPNEYSIEDRFLWRHSHMFGDPKPDILFPEGAYDRRFYLVRLGHVEGVTHWLAYETKEWVRGQVITHRWKLPLAEGVPDEMPLDLGTLEMLFYRRGLHIVGTVPDEIKPSLTATKGFAAYHINPILPFFNYWYVRPDGTETSGESYDWSWPKYSWRGEAPDTPFPYSVTSEEKSALTKQQWKYHHPWDDKAVAGETRPQDGALEVH